MMVHSQRIRGHPRCKPRVGGMLLSHSCCLTGASLKLKGTRLAVDVELHGTPPLGERREHDAPRGWEEG